MKTFEIKKNATTDFKLEVIDNINLFIAENTEVSDIEITISSKRTNQQNKALHKYFELLSDALNEKGLDFNKIFKRPQSLMITPVLVKELMWRPVQKALFGKVSTKDLEKQSNIDMVYDVINKKVSEWGVYVPFPDKEFLRENK